MVSARGVATLPTVMVLAALTLSVAVGITAVSLTESFMSQSGTHATEALFYAESGARDALTKIARNKGYSCSTADCYKIDFVTGGCTGGVRGCAKISVSGDAGTTAAPKIVTSKGVVGDISRTIRATVVLDGGTAAEGQITSTTWTELTN